MINPELSPPEADCRSKPKRTARAGRPLFFRLCSAWPSPAAARPASGRAPTGIARPADRPTADRRVGIRPRAHPASRPARLADHREHSAGRPGPATRRAGRDHTGRPGRDHTGRPAGADDRHAGRLRFGRTEDRPDCKQSVSRLRIPLCTTNFTVSCSARKIVKPDKIEGFLSVISVTLW
jgi:hypothetical protein